MEQTNKVKIEFRMILLSVMDTFWAIGTSVIAGGVLFYFAKID